MTRRPGWARGALAVVVVVAASVLMVHLARVDTRWGAPTGPDRLRLVIDAEAAIQPADAARAHRILQSRPVDGRAYRVLAGVALQAGQGDKAAELHRIAVARWPRDRLARAHLADLAFAHGDVDTALMHVDALLRVAPDARGPLLTPLMPLLADQRVRDGVVDRVAAHPPWRGALPAALLAGTTSPDIADALLADLAARGPLTESELRARITVLERRGQPGTARELWLAALPPSARAAADRMFDGGFEHPEIRGGYGWHLDAPPGVGIEYDTLAPREGTASLAITFEGRALRFGGVRQPLVLVPGRYSLAMDVRNDTGSSRPFAWRITCREGHARLVELPVPASMQWQTVGVDFEVPPRCIGQDLELRHLARSLAESQVAGVLRFDGMRIFPRP